MGGPLRSDVEHAAADMSHLQYDEHRTFDAIWIQLEERRLGKTSKRAQPIAVSVKHMNSFELEPKHSTSQIPGKCIKCLAEQELNNCLLELLEGGENEQELQRRYETLLTFLKSPESQKLRDESERYLAEGRRVMLKLAFGDGEPRYELKVD